MTASNESATQVNSPLVSKTLLQDRYRIIRQLGRGGMGAVYEAVDERLGITVALKETFSTEPSTRRQFEQEARLLANLQHAALPRVSDHFVESDRAFLVMQYIGGVDLAKIISQQPGPFPRDQVIAWADQLLDALVYLHSHDRQVIHRDIKPHNLKLTANGQIALLDFGLAKSAPCDTSVTSSRAFFGYTKHYAPLEQIQDQRTDPRSDIYALGATLYHLLTGAKPPDALARATAVLNSEPDPLPMANKVNPAVGEPIAAILNKALALKSEERFATANEFRDALRQVGRAKVEASVHRPVTKEARVDSGHQTDLTRVVLPAKEINMAMVASAKRFGPGGMTAVLVVLVAVPIGISYGASGWFKLNAAGVTAAVKKSPNPETSTARKDERPRSNATMSLGATRIKSQDDIKPTDKHSRKKEATVERKPELKRRTEENRKAPQMRRKVDAPNIRLPNPDFGEPTASLRSESSRRNSVQSYPSPQFFRAADGSYIVKFSDGSSRVVRLGERTGN
jgi:serine/threonine protein kinase